MDLIAELPVASRIIEIEDLDNSHLSSNKRICRRPKKSLDLRSCKLYTSFFFFSKACIAVKFGSALPITNQALLLVLYCLN